MESGDLERRPRTEESVKTAGEFAPSRATALKYGVNEIDVAAKLEVPVSITTQNRDVHSPLFSFLKSILLKYILAYT